MNDRTYDIITVGGGLGGSAIAKAMAENGARVLVLEPETSFRDRVRGESLLPWGVAEAKMLGVYDTLMESCGHEAPWLDRFQGPERVLHRDFRETTSCNETAICFYHPAMQEVLIQAAADAGADVRRGAKATSISLDEHPTVQVRAYGGSAEFRARMIIGADGRNSLTRGWADFQRKHEPEQNMLAGLLFDNMPAPADANQYFPNHSIGQAAIIFPQGSGRVRTYFVIPAGGGKRLSGEGDIPHFIESSLKCGVPHEYFADARPAGPLATFDGAGIQVEHPFKDGVALIGDAAAQSDPCFGQGLSTTLRDARVLRDQLLANDDWSEAGNAYAKEHNRYFNVTLTIESWLSQVLYAIGPESDALRERVMPLWEEDATRPTDVPFSGPDIEITETVRRRFFGEE